MVTNNGLNGENRGAGGRFAPGNTIASGPRSVHAARLRKAMFDCVTPEDILEIMSALITEAKGGGVIGIQAAKLLFDRLLGKAQADVVVPEDDEPLSDEEKREQLLKRFAKLSPEAQTEVRTRLREQRKATAS